jgi:hypothetical protein
MAGTHAVICDVCVLSVGTHRRELVAPDDGCCSFCGRSHLEAPGLFEKDAVTICGHCLDLSLGLVERQEVDRFMAAY